VRASAACGARTRFSLQAGVFGRAGRVYAPHVVLNDIDEAYLAELEAALGADHAYVLGDVSVEETAERLAATARERFGRIDALVNNVGDLFIGEITETSVEAWAPPDGDESTKHVSLL
jgi:NAD(P)-dependent dehydrogenase (short-subunit alcohol dehydrogenase family)